MVSGSWNSSQPRSHQTTDRVGFSIRKRCPQKMELPAEILQHAVHGWFRCVGLSRPSRVQLLQPRAPDAGCPGFKVRLQKYELKDSAINIFSGTKKKLGEWPTWAITVPPPALKAVSRRLLSVHLPAQNHSGCCAWYRHRDPQPQGF